ncbi:uroporphyrinogen-III synthase [Flavobacterium rhizosphaerae]|uniref:Uroporphyrinogen-III synthase n=1 Tax=Flavobacterium rhizosphaerae TaxID=3163298 RepID=A0ABW8YXN0_9FLAO
MQTSARILSTKKLLPNQRQFLLNAGLSVIEGDFIKVQSKNFDINATKANLIFTSRNAFKSFLKNKLSVTYRGSNMFCVGSTTATFIRQNGYTVVVEADNAQQLAETIVNNYKTESFTFFSGNMSRDELPVTLTSAGVDFNEVEVYETVLASHKINSSLNGIMFFSPSGIESFLKENSITTETCFCIGATTASALKDITQNIVVANKPSIENVIIQVRNQYNPLFQKRGV